MQGGAPEAPDDYASDIEAMNIAGAVLPPASRTLRWVVLVVTVLVLAVDRPGRGGEEPTGARPPSSRLLVPARAAVRQDRAGATWTGVRAPGLRRLPRRRGLPRSSSIRQRRDDRGHDRRSQSARVPVAGVGPGSGHLDVFNEQDQLRGSGVLGYYSYNAERISLRSSEATPPSSRSSCASSRTRWRTSASTSAPVGPISRPTRRSGPRPDAGSRATSTGSSPGGASRSLPRPREPSTTTWRDWLRARTAPPGCLRP